MSIYQPILDLTPLKIGILDLTPFEIGISDLTPFEIGILGLQDPPYTPLEISRPNLFRKSTCICWIGSLRTQIILTLCADNTVVRGYGMGDRFSFFHMAMIELILQKHFCPLISEYQLNQCHVEK